jgi:hypothetical protein
LDLRAAVCFPYDTMLELIERLKACLETAQSRTHNWQQFCLGRESVLPFLLRVSFALDDGVGQIVLQLLQCALCPEQPKAKGTAAAAGPPQSNSQA